MGKATKFQNNFAQGEISPLLAGRWDYQGYNNSVAIMQNYYSKVVGTARYRQGSQFIAETKDSTKNARNIKFQFNVEQAYNLEFGHQYIRFYKDGGIITSSGTTPYEVATPYQESELFELKFAQSNDIMWIVHPNHKPRKLSRLAHNNWNFVNYAPTNDPFTTASNYPSCVTFHEQRIIFANTIAKPNTLFVSQSANQEIMTTGTNDSDGFIFTIASQESNPILDIVSDTALFARNL